VKKGLFRDQALKNRNGSKCMAHVDEGRSLIMWKLLNSRKFAIYTLTVMLFMLVVSSFLPNHYTFSDQEWYILKDERPRLFWIASNFSTPFLVTNPLFLVVSFALFLSTLACTINRVNKWYRFRALEFTKDKAFSFSKEEETEDDIESIRERIKGILSKGRWERTVEQEGGSVIISGQKGMSGFWGSIVFHVGLIICFFAGPVTALTTFRGQFVVPEDLSMPLREGMASHVGKSLSTLPDLSVKVHDFSAEFFEGRFKYDFRGMLTFTDEYHEKDVPFAVNEPVDYRGYQFSLHEFGYSPHVIIKKEGRDVFDFYLNLRHPEKGDNFDIVGEDMRAFVMFFPDFFREGSTVGSRTRRLDNPVTMIKLHRDGREVFKGLFKFGDSEHFEGYTITVADYRHWVNLVVVREAGMHVVIVGFVIGVAGLFVRFLSNERRLEFELSPRGELTMIKVSGYSRYYPEVVQMAETIRESDHVLL
jgi:cytochrome c biogenesis protein